MSGKVLSSTVKKINSTVWTDPLVLLSVLGVLVLVIVVGFFIRSKQIDSFESYPAPFVTENSVYSSFPVEKKQDNGYNFMAPYDQTCIAGNENGTCKQNRKFNVMLTPHNQRVEYWE